MVGCTPRDRDDLAALFVETRFHCRRPQVRQLGVVLEAPRVVLPLLALRILPARVELLEDRADEVVDVDRHPVERAELRQAVFELPLQALRRFDLHRVDYD